MWCNTLCFYLSKKYSLFSFNWYWLAWCLNKSNISLYGNHHWILLVLAGLGFITSLIFVFFIGMFASSWVGATVFWIGEWFIKRMPFVKHIYSASKQISTAISPGNTVIFGLKIHYYPEFNILLEFRIYTQYIIRVITATGSMTYTSQITIMIEIVNFTFSRLHSEFRFLVIFQYFVIFPQTFFEQGLPVWGVL